MITRIVLGAAASTAFHAFVLFGLNWPARQASGPAVKGDEPLITWIAPLVEEPPIEASGEPKESGPAGRPDSNRPRADEFISETKADFTLKPVVDRFRPENPSTERIAIEPPGIPGGDGDGPGGPPVLRREMLDNEPRTRARVAPNYPAEARSLGLTGEVVVEFIVDENGNVRHPRVVRSSDGVFESATLRAVERWRFEPGKKNGKPVRFRMAVPVVFNLET